MPPIKGQMFRYSEADMEAAVQECRRGLPTATVAKKFGVPRVTLLNKVRGKTPLKRKMGRKCYISEETEGMLVVWAKEMVKQGFPIGKENLQDSVKKIVDDLNIETPFTEGRPGKRWYNSFLKRHPDLILRQPQNLTTSRASVTTSQLKNWFEEVSTHLNDTNNREILNCPRRIFNMDETAFFLNPKGSKVLAPKGIKSVYQQINSDEKECYTVLLGGNASGDVLPPMVIFKYERIPRELSLSVPESWGIGRSDNGWMTMETFYEYICNIFDKWLNDNNIQRPVILFIDGHTSHLSFHVSKFCSENGIILIALFPNATHLLQPMDVAVFRSLKGGWKNAVHSWRLENIDSPVLRKVHFCPLLNKVLKETLTPEIFQNGFRKCGLSPWNPDEVICVAEDPKLTELQLLAKAKELEIGMKFMDKYIDADKVAKFKEVRGNDWTGANVDFGLFQFYKKVENLMMQTKSQLEPPTTEILPALNSLVPKHSSTSEIITFQTDVPQAPDSPSISLSPSTSQGIRLNSPSIMDSCLPTNENLKTPSKVADPAQASGKNLSLNQELNITTESDILIMPDESQEITELDTSDLHTVINEVPKTPNKVPRLEISQNIPSTSRQHNITDSFPNKADMVIPSPFKRALFWPKPKESLKKRKKEKVPSVITSIEWQTYYESKERKKIQAEEEKKRKAEERKKKKEETEKTRKLKTANSLVKKTSKTVKRKFKKVEYESSTEEEWIESGETDDDISDDNKSDDEENKCFEQEVEQDQIFKQGDYIIVKFPGKKKYYKYVCIVQDINKPDIEVMAMKACDSSKAVFKENVEDISVISMSEVVAVLEPPKMIITGDRIKYSFGKSLDVDG